MSTVLIGPSVEPASGEPAKKLIVLLHGLGADGEDLIGLAQPLAEHLPGAAFVAPNAPEPCDGAPPGMMGGFQWFSFQTRKPDDLRKGADAALPLLNAFLDAELEKRGLADKDLALIGFSQGAMMSLHAGLRRAKPCAGIVGFSGALIDAAALPQEITARPPVFLIHGAADQVVPFEALGAAAAGLQAAKVKTRTLVRPGLGHGIDPEGFGASVSFLKEVLA